MKKGSIVWYWHKKEWRRGKIVSINMTSGQFGKPYGLYIKDSRTKKINFVSVGYIARSGYEPKPTREPFDYTIRPWPKGFVNKHGYLDEKAYFYK